MELVSISLVFQQNFISRRRKGLSFEEVMAEKNEVTSRLNGKNYAAISSAGVDIDAEAHFLSNKIIEIVAGDESK